MPGGAAVRRPIPALLEINALGAVGSLRGRNIRSEKVAQPGQFFDLLRHLVVLRNDKDRKNGPLWCFRTTAGTQEVEQRMEQLPSRIISTAQTP